MNSKLTEWGVSRLLTRAGVAHSFLLCLVFFLVCFGLGYSTLNRYDPRRTAGTSDSIDYYRTVTNEGKDGGVQRRVLVPYLAKPIYLLARGRVKSWEPVFFALLVVNSFFCALTAFLLVVAGNLLIKDQAVSLLGAALYLLNFAVANFQLSGMVDSSAACLMMALSLALLTGRLYLLPVLMILGALAKETFVPLGALFMVLWCVAERKGLKLSRAGWAIATVAVGLIVSIVLQAVLLGHTFNWPWVDLFSRPRVSSFSLLNYLQRLLKSILAQETLYVFVWLLPLGLWRIRTLPRAWVFASLGTALFILLLGAVVDAAHNVSRPMFNVAGPILSLSVAILLSRYSSSAQGQTVTTNATVSVSEDLL